MIPLAETWGIADDIIRFDFGQKTDDRAKREFVAALANRIDEVQSWISDRPEGAELSDEAATFMYMLYAWDEVRDRDDGA